MTTDLLPKVEAEMKEKMSKLFNKILITGMTITSDGWSDVRSRPLINLMGVSMDGAFFLTSFDTSGNIKTGEYISTPISNWKLGPEKPHTLVTENIIQVITDSAANCVASGRLLEKKFPQLNFSRCSAHIIDLILKDISNLYFITPIFVKCHRVLRFFKNHSFLKTEVEKKANLTLVKPGETRFATNYLVLSRLLKIKAALKLTVIDDHVRHWVHLQDSKSQREFLEIESSVLNELLFWDEISDLIKLFVDTDSPTISKIVPLFSKVLEKLKTANLRTFSQEEIELIEEINEKREATITNDLHLVAYALDPFYADVWVHDDSRIINAVPRICSKILGQKFKEKELESKVELAKKQFLQYKLGNGIVMREVVQEERKTTNGFEWWMEYGCLMPELQYVAQRILAQVSSSSSAERNWSVFRGIHTDKRNRLGVEVPKSLVFANFNSQVLKKMDAVDYNFNHKILCELESEEAD
ncbi:hypothetical protein GEMRC1_003959 [Eukaryota sp. GEM-RC1]